MTDQFQYLFPLIMNISRYFLMAGIPFLIFYIIYPDIFSKNKIQSRSAGKKDFLREIKQSIQTTFILAGVGLLILRTPLSKYTQLYTDINEHSLWWIPMSILLALIVHDTYFYWMHRIVHHPRLFRPVHLLHHRSINPSPWTSYSFHFLETILEAMVAPLILILVPVHPIALIIFTFLGFGVNIYGHLGFEIAPKWLRHSILFEVLNTSTHHNMHHAKFKGNYGLYFRVWDRIMGTEHPDYVKEYDKIQKRRFGMSSNAPESWQIHVFILLLAFLVSATTLPSKGIEGKWKFDKNDAIIEIYEEDGLYYGELIDIGNEVDRQRLQEHGKVFLLKSFEKKSDTKYCCGTLYAPKKRKTLQATIYLESPDRLRIEVGYGILKGNEILRSL